MHALILINIREGVKLDNKTLVPTIFGMLIALGYPKGPLFMNETSSVSVLFLVSHIFFYFAYAVYETYVRRL